MNILSTRDVFGIIFPIVGNDSLEMRLTYPWPVLLREQSVRVRHIG